MIVFHAQLTSTTRGQQSRISINEAAEIRVSILSTRLFRF